MGENSLDEVRLEGMVVWELAAEPGAKEEYIVDAVDEVAVRFMPG